MGAPGAVPDARGRFGQFAVRMCAGNADAGARRAGIRLRRSSPRSQVPGRGRSSRARLRRPPDAYFARNLTDLGAARDLPPRRSRTHRRAQDQQRARPGSPRQADGKQRIIAETGAGQHGVATATVCALLGLECIVYMGEIDIARQSPNVFRMKLSARKFARSARLAHAQGRDQRGDPRLGR